MIAMRQTSIKNQKVQKSNYIFLTPWKKIPELFIIFTHCQFCIFCYRFLYIISQKNVKYAKKLCYNLTRAIIQKQIVPFSEISIGRIPSAVDNLYPFRDIS